MMNSFVTGVDIGGSHITAALVDMEKRVMVEEAWCREMVDSNGSAEAILSGWSRVIRSCMVTSSNRISCIGIAMPGPFDYEEGISYIRDQNKYDALYGVNVKQALAKELEIDPDQIRFLNDAACFLKGEAFNGVVKGHATAFGITLGTGFGSAFYKCNEATDANLWCAPFKKGIAEDYFSTRWFTKRYAEKTARQVSNVKELAARYQEDVHVKGIFEEFGENLAEFIEHLMVKEPAEVIVFGGNIAESFDYFAPAIRQRLAARYSTVLIKRSVLNEYATLLGSASCWVPAGEVV